MPVAVPPNHATRRRNVMGGHGSPSHFGSRNDARRPGSGAFQPRHAGLLRLRPQTACAPGGPSVPPGPPLASLAAATRGAPPAATACAAGGPSVPPGPPLASLGALRAVRLRPANGLRAAGPPSLRARQLASLRALRAVAPPAAAGLHPFGCSAAARAAGPPSVRARPLAFARRRESTGAINSRSGQCSSPSAIPSASRSMPIR